MPRLAKPTPEKYCSWCGERLERKRLKNGKLESLLHFGKRKYCNRTCMAAAFDARESASDDWTTCHYHARKLVPEGCCEICGSPNATDVHHKDGNHENNLPENLQRICRGCHLKQHRTKHYCMICGKPVKGLGYCDKHYQRFKKYGDPLMVKQNQHTPITRLDD